MCWCEGDIPLHILPSFNITNGAVIDYMHCLLEGIGKKLFQLWLTTLSNRYYIGQSIHCKNKLVVLTTEWLLWLQTS